MGVCMYNAKSKLWDDSAPALDPPGPQYYWSLETTDVTDVKREDENAGG